MLVPTAERMAVLVIWLEGAKAFDSIATIAAATRRMVAKKREENIVDFVKRGMGVLALSLW